MKPAQFGIVAMVGIIITILFAGCVAEEAPVAGAPAATSLITPVTTTSTSSITPVPTTPGCAYPPLNPWTGVPESYISTLSEKPDTLPAPGTRFSRADILGTPALNWKSYDHTSEMKDLSPTGEPVTSGSESRTEISNEDYQGKPAIHKRSTSVFRITAPSPSPEQTTIDDTYYDEMNTVLHQHRKVIVNGETNEDRDIPVETAGTSPDCSGDLWKPTYTYTGIDSVTVPTGTYPYARKFQANVTDLSFSRTATITLWFAPGIPVEVKKVIEDKEKGSLFTLELTGWG